MSLNLLNNLLNGTFLSSLFTGQTPANYTPVATSTPVYSPAPSTPSSSSSGSNLPLANDNRTVDIEYLNLDDTGVDALENILDTNAIRNVSGFGNNLNHPEFAAAQQPFIRLTDEKYGANEAPRGVVNGVQTLPNERDISNVIANQDENRDGVEDKTSSVHGTNLFLMSFGQFFDHGLDFIERSSNPLDKYTIALKPGDSLYKFSDDGDASNDVTSMRITRGAEAIDANTGQPIDPRAHTNKTSPFIDQNQTYGSSDAVTYYLRQTATDADGNVMRDAEGKLVKLATLKNGFTDDSGFPMLPTYEDILINNGMSKATIDAAVAANDFTILMRDAGFVDFRNVIDPVTRQPDGNPLLLDSAFGTDPNGPQFNLRLLLDHNIAGDGRANENIQLTPIHTIFHRDHEYWVGVLTEKTGGAWSQEEYFQAAKSIVESEYQRVIFDEFVDALAGSLPGPIPHGFDGYHPRVNAQISEEFAHAIYRVGHSMVTEKVPFTGADGSVKQMSLVEAFLNPAQFADTGVDALIGGNLKVAHERIDENIVNAVRNQLLGQPSDLAAINIARGREVGLGSLNDVRRMLYNSGSNDADSGSDVTRALKGNSELKPYSSWEEFGQNLRDPSLLSLFKQVYKNVDDVDLWIGGLAEKPRSQEEGQMGKTFTWIFWEQMDRLQDGDRFYYKGRFADTEVLGLLETQMFSDIIMRNSGQEFLNDKVFFLTNEIRMGLSEKARTFSSANETIVGNALDNEIKAGAGNDTVYGQAGNDKIWGGDGNDGLRGEDGNDTLYGEHGDDRIVGGEGDDTLYGGDEEDALNGNEGNDTLYGEEGDDEVHGNEGDDTLVGGNGNDVIKGGIGNDKISGDAGNDYIETNGGDDQVNTGSGRDVILMSQEAGFVTVNDFDVNHDRVDLKMFGVSNADELRRTLEIHDVTGGAALKVGDSVIMLKGVSSSKLTMDNFKFRNDDQNLVINGRMDEKRLDASQMSAANPTGLVDPLANSDWAYVENEKSVGWRNLNDNRVELQRIRGNEVLELDTDSKVDEIYQDMPTRQGEVYALSFDAMARSGGKAGTSAFEVYWNGKHIGHVDPLSNWEAYSVNVVGTGGKDRLSFKEDASTNDTHGALIDNVLVVPADGQPEVYQLKGNGAANVYKDMTGITEYIDGQAGDDVYSVIAPAAAFDIERNAEGETIVRKGDHVLAVLKNIETIRFTDGDYHDDGNGNWYTEGTDNSGGGTGTDDLNGTDGDDYIVGTDGDDVMKGGNGNDSFVGGKGNDLIDGEGGSYNQIDLMGSRGDYTFTGNDDGSYTVSSATYGTDTLKNIHGVWFDGSQEQADLGSLVGTGSGGSSGNLNGTDGDDYIVGTDGDDAMKGGNGNDTFVGGKGNDHIDGEGGAHNQIDLLGAKEDYAFSMDADGHTHVSSAATGEDILMNINGVWFDGSQEYVALNELVH